MPSFIRDPKDFWTGLLYLAFGSGAVYIASDYGMGSATRMGPGYFPTVLGVLLALIGVAAMARSLVRPGEAIGPFAWKGLVLVLVACVLFGVLARGAGLAVSLTVLVLVSAYASIHFRAGPALALAAGMVAFCVLVFIKGLGVALPVLGPWLGG